MTNNFNEFDVARYQVKDRLKELVLLDIELRRNLVKNELVADATYRGCIEFECGRAFERMTLSNALNINIKELLLESSKVVDELIAKYSIFEEDDSKDTLNIVENKIRLALSNYNNKFNTIKYKLDNNKWHKTSIRDVFRIDQLAAILKEDLDYNGGKGNA